MDLENLGKSVDNNALWEIFNEFSFSTYALVP